MGNGGNEGWKAGLVGSAVLLAALVGPGVATVSAKSAPTRQMTVVERTAVAAAVADVAVVASVDALEAAAAAPVQVPLTKQRRLRRLKHQELNMDLILVSADLIKRHHAKRIGSEIEVEIAGKPYVARIERHFHPEGGAIKPWGFHPGVSLFAVEWTSAT
jgi:uncharacterized cupredoxin-like copper-binding protein